MTILLKPANMSVYYELRRKKEAWGRNLPQASLYF